MRQSVAISVASLCFFLLPEFVLAVEVVAPQAGETRQPRAIPQRPPRFETTTFDVEADIADSEAMFEALGRADKKRLTVPLSADGITHIRLRRASSSGVGSYVSCSPTSMLASSNLDLSEIVSALEHLCDAIIGVANYASDFRSEYDLLMSLKKPLMGVSTLRWHAATLDDAMTIARSVQEGRIESAIVRTHNAKKKPEPGANPIKYELEPCQECLILEWVLRASGKK